MSKNRVQIKHIVAHSVYLIHVIWHLEHQEQNSVPIYNIVYSIHDVNQVYVSKI